MKVIFLDFDGVITTRQSKYKLDPEKMALVGRILDATDAKIVISSSWRGGSLEETIKHITDKEHFLIDGNPFPYPEAVIGVTERMCSFCYPNSDRFYELPRGCEIEHYLHQHSEIDSYVIIDDDQDMLLCQADNFVPTAGWLGITEKDVEKAIKILNNSNDK
jgi:hypothetical protein